MKNYQTLKLSKTSAAILLACGLGVVNPAFAREEWAHLFGNTTGRCNICHTGSVGTGDNVKSAAKSAYKSSGLSPGLKNYVTNFLANETPATPNTKPVLNEVNAQYDVIAGESVTIPLVVKDTEDDAFSIVNKSQLPAGATVADAGVDSSTQLPKWEFKWTPTAAQQNKIYTVKFAAKETSTSKKYTSNTIASKIRVWPAGNQDNAKVSGFVLSTASWSADVLTLKGKVTPNKLLTAAEKSAFFARTDLPIELFQGKTTDGAIIASPNLTLSANGSWTLTQALPGTFSCNVTVRFEGRNASRKIAKAPATCLK